ncbi:MAG: hypothetical protein M1825_004386 [Sarcosagium campestre]|nr:MAG: hypothetical protein M1825_004386 [Sarcosagium campestre]
MQVQHLLQQPPVQQSKPQQQPRIRPLTVDEALQYTPLSSIVPFGPDPLPVPLLGSRDTASVFTSPEERNKSEQILQSLSEELKSSHGSSPFCKQTVQHLKHLLSADGLTSYQFKTPIDFGFEPAQSAQVAKMNGSSSPISTSSHFANLVLESTDVQFRYPTPSTQASVSPKARPISGQNSTALQISQKSPNQQAYSRNVGASACYNGVAPSERQSIGKPAIIVPALSSSFRSQEYIDVPDRDTGSDHELVHDFSRKRRPSENDQDDEPLAWSADQRERAEASLQGLQEMLASIFEAEDQFQPDTSGVSTSHGSSFFVVGGGTEDSSLTLDAAAQIRLDAALEKVISVGKFDAVPVDDVLRVQKLCEGALKSAETVDIKIEKGWGDTEVASWMQRIDVLDLGLKASRTLLRIMTSGRGEKRLSPEEMLQTILNVVKNALESCITPVVELRNSGTATETFKALTTHKKHINAVLNHAAKALRLLAALIVKEEVTENAITTVEFLAAGLIFVENGSNEKESILGVQKFERLRVAAMDVLVKIFSRYPDQRTFIFDEILTSLERLPVTRQKARQYKLIEGDSIQLVSALILRLVQTSAMRTDEGRASKKKAVLKLSHENGSMDKDDDESSTADELESAKDQPEPARSIDTEAKAERYPDEALQQLSEAFQPLLDSASKNAHYVIQFLVSRALKSTKSGDDPYRVLLDIFTGDFITVVTSTDWPAAELLLRSLLSQMVGLAEAEKSPAPAKNMALDLMAIMGAAISNIVTRIRNTSRSIENGESGLDRYLVQLSEDFLDGKLQDADVLVWDGPYRATLEYLQDRDLNDGQIQSACGYYTTQWASKIYSMQAATAGGGDDAVDVKTARMAFRLRKMIFDRRWLEVEYDFDSVTTAQGRLAYALTIVNMPFGKAFDRILLILLNSMNSEQATVRSKSLRSVIQLIEKDPTILERGAYVMQYILERSRDPSPLVRDSAMGLIGKCLALNPSLEDEIWKSVRARVIDLQVGVRKRSMKILKDIYLRTGKKDVKTAIADALLHRVMDTDEGVADLARQMLEETWMVPFVRSEQDGPATFQHKLAVKEQVILMVRTVQRGESVSSVLESLLKSLLAKDAKNCAANFQVCKAMVASMFDDILDDDEQTDRPRRNEVLRTLTVFAQAKPNLFTTEQVELLQPYIEHLSKNDDLEIYKSVIVIYRWVLPRLSSIKNSFLVAVQQALLASLNKLGRLQLGEVVSCLWTINGVLQNIDRLSRVVISCIKGINAARSKDLSKDVFSVTRYITIAGLFGKICEFDADIERFKAAFPVWKGDSVPSLMIEAFAPFTSPKTPHAVRRAALDAVCAVCQSWPKQFLKEQVCSAFEIVFREGNQELENLVLKGIRDYLSLEEKRSEKGANSGGNDDDEDESGRIGRSFANENDGISSSLIQRFLKQTIRIALASQDAFALTAVEVMASVSRQGLVHPKECSFAMVALETSQNAAIAGIASREHRALYQKHETIFGKEYMKAVHQAFIYQRDVVKDAQGATAHPFVSKLRPLFEVIKMSNAKVRKKFLANMCSRIDFDTSKLEVQAEVPSHLQYARFLVENLAFFEYSTLDDLLHVLSCMERVVTGTGTIVAHALETEIFKVQLDPAENGDGGEQMAVVQSVEPPVDPTRRRQLVTASMILSCVWEVRNFLRKLYGVGSASKQRESKSKDLAKPPSKFPFVSGDKMWEEIGRVMKALSSAEAGTAQCKAFVELMSVDDDFKLAVGEDGDVRMQTPSDDDMAGTPAPASGSGKGRKRRTTSDTPGKRPKIKRRRSSGSKARKMSDASGEDDGAH